MMQSRQQLNPKEPGPTYPPNFVKVWARRVNTPCVYSRITTVSYSPCPFQTHAIRGSSNASSEDALKVHPARRKRSLCLTWPLSGTLVVTIFVKFAFQTSRHLPFRFRRFVYQASHKKQKAKHHITRRFIQSVSHSAKRETSLPRSYVTESALLGYHATQQP